jgi:hypothetical protein
MSVAEVPAIREAVCWSINPRPKKRSPSWIAAPGRKLHGERITVVRQYARTQSPVRGRRKGMTILREGGGDATILDHSKSQNWDSAAIQVRCSARAKLGYGRIAVDVIWITDEQRPFMPAKASTNHKLNIL